MAIQQEQISYIKVETALVFTVAITPDGRSAVSTSDDHTLRVWDLASGRVRATLKGFTGRFVMAPDGQSAVSVSYNRTLRVWDLASGHANTRAIFEDHIGLALILRVWDLASGRARTTLEGHASVVSAVAITPDGQSAVSASWDTTLCVWDLASGHVRATLEGHADKVTAVAITPDGQSAVSASDDHTLRMWDLKTYNLQLVFAASASFECCAIAPAGNIIVAGDDSGAVHILEWVNRKPLTPGAF